MAVIKSIAYTDCMYTVIIFYEIITDIAAELFQIGVKTVNILSVVFI